MRGSRACGTLRLPRPAVGQGPSAAQGISHLFQGAIPCIPGAMLAGPACRKVLAQHLLMGFSTGKPGFGQLAAVLVADVTDRRERAVPITQPLRELAALAADVDDAVRRVPLGIQGRPPDHSLSRVCPAWWLSVT